MAGGWVVNRPPAASMARLERIEPEPRTKLIVHKGANGSFRTIVPAWLPSTSTRSSTAQSSR